MSYFTDKSSRWNNFLRSAFPFHDAASRTVFRGIEEAVNAKTQQDRNRLTVQWIEGTVSQLQSVGLIGAIVVSAEVGTFTWPTLLYTSDITWVLVRLLWYVSLILAIGAIAVSLQQSVFLARITHTSASVDLIQELLSEVVPNRPTIRQPRQGQIILWQLANGLLETSIYFWLSGLLVFLWATTVAKTGRSLEDIIIAAGCMTAFGITLGLYLWSMLGLWNRVNKAKYY